MIPSNVVGNSEIKNVDLAVRNAFFKLTYIKGHISYLVNITAKSRWKMLQATAISNRAKVSRVSDTILNRLASELLQISKGEATHLP